MESFGLSRVSIDVLGLCGPGRRWWLGAAAAGAGPRTLEGKPSNWKGAGANPPPPPARPGGRHGPRRGREGGWRQEGVGQLVGRRGLVVVRRGRGRGRGRGRRQRRRCRRRCPGLGPEPRDGLGRQGRRPPHPRAEEGRHLGGHPVRVGRSGGGVVLGPGPVPPLPGAAAAARRGRGRGRGRGSEGGRRHRQLLLPLRVLALHPDGSQGRGGRGRSPGIPPPRLARRGPAHGGGEGGRGASPPQASVLRAAPLEVAEGPGGR